MKGNPPFSRKPVAIEFHTPASAGFGPAIRKAMAKPLVKTDDLAIVSTGDAIWLVTDCGTGARVHLRLCQEPHGIQRVTVSAGGRTLRLRAEGALGVYSAFIEKEQEDPLMLRVRVQLRTRSATKLEGAARDICVTNRRHEPLADGLLFTSQAGASAGHVFAAAADACLFYFQNLSALGRYAGLTGASLVASVGVDWPMLGLKLPPGDEPLPRGEKVLLSDTFLRIAGQSHDGESARALEFLKGLAAAYRKTAPPPGPWIDWRAMARRTLRDLKRSPKCMRKIAGVYFFNAYVGGDDKPPESMVQAALQVPLGEYETWSGKPQPLATRVAGSLEAFRLQEFGTIARWLPGETFGGDEPSEEESHERMDSWYLLHTMMDVAQLAKEGKTAERQLFLDSLEYLIRVAQHFDHDWPVFYHRKTLRVFKRETAPGCGGEQDAAGLYAQVMMLAWELTRDRRYLDEAETSAKKLKGLGFGMLYQTNNTLFTAIALARLWKETGNAEYKDLSFVCMGSILSHLWMWEPAGAEKSWRTYMGLPPLHVAPYLAPYEEAEILAGSRTYLELLGEDAPPELEELWVEYGKHLLGRAHHYFPSELPTSGLTGSPKEGQVDTSLAIPIEDLYPPHEPAGQVGQEVYGAALALILCTRSFHRWRAVPFTLWSEAPLKSAEFEVMHRDRKGCLRIGVRGSPRHLHALRFIRDRHRPVRLSISIGNGEGKVSRTASSGTPEGHRLIAVPGGSEITVEWRRSGS